MKENKILSFPQQTQPYVSLLSVNLSREHPVELDSLIWMFIKKTFNEAKTLQLSKNKSKR